VVPFDGDKHGIVGALKRFACEQCLGDYLVELDHDDLLVPQALEVLGRAIEENENPDFLYSDFVEFRPDWTSRAYEEKYGWESYEVSFFGRSHTAMRAFPPTAAALQQIFYAPNHVRVWRRDTYFAIGGHDPDMPICDDQDLLIRTYLAGKRFVHIPEVLYFYRLQDAGGNTYLERNKEIQEKQQEIANKYIYALIEEECRRNNMPRVDLGGGHGSPSGYLAVDLVGGDVCCDIRQGLPFEDNSIGCVRAYDFLEHIPHCPDSSCEHGANGRPMCVVGIMNEIYRVLAPGGWLISRTPSTDGRGAFQDPTHCSFWNPNSFWYYTRHQQAQYVRGIDCRFQATRIWQAHPSDWHRNNNILYVFADLVALKGQRQPGMCEI
jgi:SAM-dependent methyltransferase